MSETAAIAIIFASMLTIPFVWLLCFVYDPWPDGYWSPAWSYLLTIDFDPPAKPAPKRRKRSKRK